MSNPKPIIVEQTFNASPETVWRAITDVEQMRKWFFAQIESFKPQVGFETQFDVESNGRHFLHQWKITEVEPGKKIVYNWRYGGYSAESFVTFELFDDGDQTRLRLTHEGIEQFPPEAPEFSREACLAGWMYFIQTSLRDFLEGNN